MRDDEGRSPLDQPGDRLLHLVFGNVIQRAGRLVQDEDARVADERAGNGHALFLPAAELAALLSDKGIQPVRQVFDELVQICQFRHALHQRVIDVFQPVDDVFADGARKQQAVLRYDGEKAAVIGQGELRDVVPVYVQRALRRGQKPDDQVHERGFSAAGRPDDGNALPRRYVQAEIFHHISGAVGVFVTYVFKPHRAFQRFQFALSRAVFHVFGEHDLGERAERLEPDGKGGQHVDDGLHRAVDGAEHGLIQHDIARRDPAEERKHGAHDEAGDAHQRGDHPQRRTEIRVGAVYRKPAFGQFSDIAVTQGDLLFFQPVRLGDGQHAQHGGKTRGNIFVFHTVEMVFAAHALAEKLREQNVGGDDDDEERRDHPAVVYGDADGNERDDDVGDEHLDQVGVQRVYAFDIL